MERATSTAGACIQVQTEGMGDQEFRVEHDTMGEVKVPANALWRALDGIDARRGVMSAA